ncbi:hypothetical protein GPY51_08560 [Photorhabdus laumondii subsp. laumondii]|uniref:Photorhabdus luminescens subsp. laumondii TTO1 complete genome segment 3/17 n=2 Tax=Photorhabdus laumondii subsp. laumondii TaxID=141679 RepID=Q7N8E7_PHOLL|nr:MULTISPECIES: hypothetical protein [Photorhabdus]AWK40721.1 hypothetical protein A4R40_03890 [Photorhabdus laumondii subsp. laumondii]AXG41534.1 hypothetical protein PluDJC_03970 [Photorhabdus laumondii subsp. laumondii]AXG46057.1 hypothetical protein PluTT01m_04000 [Photorhabdus laumondii subsp. laumondii]KTL61032.1 hypothetical protein AA106_02135 [Photorhabdus laumondii subsp. laumondii]MCC8384315.1 hypothetical protein [Photorhabdus laumondii]
MKKQMMKTSVLAAVLLSMGMGMAHAAAGDVLASNSVVVNGVVGAASCVLNVTDGGASTTSIDLGAINQSAIKSGQLIGTKKIKVELGDCSQVVDSNDNTKLNTGVGLRISGTASTVSADYFAAPGDTNNKLAVAVQNGSKFLKPNDAVSFTKGALLTDVMQELDVGMIAKTPSDVTAGMSVSVPLTFQLIEK